MMTALKMPLPGPGKPARDKTLPACSKAEHLIDTISLKAVAGILKIWGISTKVVSQQLMQYININRLVLQENGNLPGGGLTVKNCRFQLA